MKMCPESPYTHHLYIMQSAFKFTNTWNFWLVLQFVNKISKPFFLNLQQKTNSKSSGNLLKKSCKNSSKWDVKVLMLTTGSFSQIDQEFMFPSSFHFITQVHCLWVPTEHLTNDMYPVYLTVNKTSQMLAHLLSD